MKHLLLIVALALVGFKANAMTPTECLASMKSLGKNHKDMTVKAIMAKDGSSVQFWLTPKDNKKPSVETEAATNSALRMCGLAGYKDFYLYTKDNKPVLSCRLTNVLKAMRTCDEEKDLDLTKKNIAEFK